MQRPHVPKTEQPATRDQGTRIDRQMQAQKSSVRGNSLTGGAGFKEEEEDGGCRLPEEMEKRQDPKGKWMVVHTPRKSTEKQWPQQHKTDTNTPSRTLLIVSTIFSDLLIAFK